MQQFVGDHEILKPGSCSIKSSARVMVPVVEQEPHFRVIRCTRIIRGFGLQTL